MGRTQGITRVIVLGLLALVPRSAVPQTCAPQLRASLPLQIQAYHVTFPVTVNGRETQFALDTGTSDSYMLQPARDAMALPDAPTPESWTVGSIGGNVAQAEFVMVKHLGFAGRDYGPRVMPLANGDTAPPDPKEFGLIGADLLKDVDVDLDIPGARIGFYSVEAGCSNHSPPWAAQSTRVPIVPLASGSPTIPVDYDGTTKPTLFATYWERTLVQDFPKGAAGHPAIVSDPRQPPLAPLAIFKSIAIGAMKDGPLTVRLWRKPPIVTYATKPEPNNVSTLGFDVIRKHRFWLSLASKQLFVALPN